jgi:hypothetical protein
LIAWNTNCPLCGAHFNDIRCARESACDHNTSFVAEVTTDDVQNAVAELLSLHHNKVSEIV